MKSGIILLLFLILYQTSQAQVSQQDYESVFKTVESYFSGWKSKDKDLLTEIFRPESTLKYINRQGAFESVTIKQHIDDITAPDASFLPAHVKDINNVFISHNGASATVSLRFKTFEVSDFFQLLKIGDSWKIVSKVSVSKQLDKSLTGG